MTENQTYQAAVSAAIQHVQHGPILPAEPLSIRPKYTCPRCRTHAGTIIDNNAHWPRNTQMRCGWCHHTYPIPD